MKSLFFSLWNCQIPHVIFESTRQFSFKFCKFSVPSNITPLYLFSTNIIHFGQRRKLNSTFFRFSSARVKICQIPHVKFEMTSQFLFKFCIILQCHDTWLLCNFKLIYFLLWTKGSHSSPNFETFKCSGENVPN